MKEKTKTVLIKEDLHNKLKFYSEKSGIKIKVIVETAVKEYLRHIIIPED